MIEINDVLRKLYTDSDMSSVTFNYEFNTIQLSVFKDYFYDGEGGFISIVWDLSSEFLQDQSQEIQILVNEHIL